MDIKKYIYSHCIDLQSVKVWDAYSQSFIIQQVPCGKCLHCKNSAVNEWVTRLYAQSKYSNFVYYITLDYAPFSYEKDSFSDSTASMLALETAACWHNLNSTHRYGMHPLLLRKNHLQDFLKRFRKNTGKKIQYFACGEYGTHAEGTGYGRPHFHLIVFSDVPITHKEFIDSWSLHGYQIGNVKYEDITSEAKDNIINSTNNAKACFKYVCKYLKKQGFDFESLRTIDFHRTYFKSLQYTFIKTDTLFPERVPISDSRTLEYNWMQYIKDFSPFVVCSKRPAIGLRYLQENVERFKTRDFRLFGLSKECINFPRYYIRKTKESFTSFVAVGHVSQKPTTNSSLGFISSVLRQISRETLDFSSFENFSPDTWSLCSKNYLSTNIKSSDKFAPCLHLYDRVNNIFYQFNGCYYILWQKIKSLGYRKLDYMSLSRVADFIDKEFTPYYKDFISPMHQDKVLSESDLNDTINTIFKGDTFQDKYNAFLSEVQSCYKSELDSLYKVKLLTNNSKNIF